MDDDDDDDSQTYLNNMCLWTKHTLLLSIQVKLEKGSSDPLVREDSCTQGVVPENTHTSLTGGIFSKTPSPHMILNLTYVTTVLNEF